MMMNALWNARKKIIGAGAIVLLVLLMMNLNSRLGEYFHLSSERDKLQTEVIQDLAARAALETQVAYATSDQAVEDYARNEAHLGRPGDKVFIPLTPPAQTVVPEAQPTPTVRSVENWEVWWALFFGQ